MRIFRPAGAPAWLEQVSASIERLFREIMPGPLRLRDYATADLPAAADYRQGLAFDSSEGTLKLATGAGWKAFADAAHGHDAASIASLPAGGLGATNVQAALEMLDASKAPLASPAFTGNPSAPTAAVGTHDGQLATTAFVRNEVAGLVASAPATLDTLAELAAALGGDPDFAASVAAALGSRLRVDTGAQELSATERRNGRANLRSGAMVRKAASQTGVSGTTIGALLFDQETYDDGGWHDNAVQPSRLTVPAGVDRVRVGGHVVLGNVTGNMAVYLTVMKNGAASFDGACGIAASIPNIGPRLSIASGPIAASAGDYFELSLYSNDTSFDISGAETNFWIEAA
jgi:hypothetical protein